MTTKQLLLPVLICIAVFAGLTEAQAQCKSFTKRKCLGELGQYTGNGQYSGAVMFEGEEAKLAQTFYSGKEYRLFLCAHPAISDSAYFEVTDYNRKLLYSSQETNDSFFEFSVESTRQLNIRVVIPDLGTGNELKKNGCVSILIGFKDN